MQIAPSNELIEHNPLAMPKLAIDALRNLYLRNLINESHAD